MIISASDALAAARSWAGADPDPDTAAQLVALIERVDVDPTAMQHLVELFDGRIAFGTAGLRAELGPGPNRMNRLVVRQTTAGLMRWLLERNDAPLVVIGYDARHGSVDFASDTAAVVATLGGRAELLPRPLPTPVLAHAVVHRRADAGVMITASHNPPTDNGYKLYLADGIQIVPPADVEIAAHIDRVAAAATPPVADADAGSSVTVLDETIVAAHLEACVAALRTPRRSVTVAYTAMHGVGGAHLRAAFALAGFPEPIVVAEQFEPNPDFPTVGFPNPEEPGALDRVVAVARRHGVDMVIANDPDADRLAMAVPDRIDSATYTPLSGDQIGVLLADHLLRHTNGSQRMVSNSIVSSRLLRCMAASAGVHHVETLTGFKWVARPIVDHPDRTFVIGYEEALGYCIGDRVRDKDGISAALVAAEMVADALAGGETLWDRLDRLGQTHGVHLTGPVTVRLDGPEGMARRAELLDTLIVDPPGELGGASLVETIDLSRPAPGFDALPPTPGVQLCYDDDTRVIVRPSGTEPKLKAYIEVIEPVDETETVSSANERATTRLTKIQEQVSRRLGAPTQ